VPAETYRTNSEDETIALGRELARHLPRPSLVFLAGNLGAGKTTLTKGIVEGLGVAARDEVSSPTFTLIHDYGQGVFHIDLYRIETPRELASLGLEDLWDRGDTIALVEWGERFRDHLPLPQCEITIEVHDEARVLTIATRQSLPCPDTAR
jgi:tRNA threonylcarbamoyladenosine biosynthesis protein TsaE